VIDPVYQMLASIAGDDKLIVMGADSQAVRAQGAQNSRKTLNQLASTLVWTAYEHLRAEFNETRLGSTETSLLKDLMFQHTPTNEGISDPPEILFVRTSRRKVTLPNKDQFEPWEYSVSTGHEWQERTAPVFIRPMSTLQAHLELPPQERIEGPPKSDQAMAVYSVNAGWDIPIDPLQMMIVERSGWREISSLLAIKNLPGPIIVWTSDVVDGRVDIKDLRKNAPVWCVCNSNPLSALRWLQQHLPELRGVPIASRVPGSALKAVIAYRVGPVGDIDGIIFPGTATMCAPIGSMLFQVYGDNCRDFNSIGPEFSVGQTTRASIGRMIVDLISITDRSFEMG